MYIICSKISLGGKQKRVAWFSRRPPEALPAAMFVYSWLSDRMADRAQRIHSTKTFEYRLTIK